MRINKFVATATGMARRQADEYIKLQRVTINKRIAALDTQVQPSDTVRLDDNILTLPAKVKLILHKPVGYVCSRDGQGSKTIYELLPEKYHILKPVGRLDKDSSGLLLLTNDGELSHKLTHPSFIKTKTYQVAIDKPLRSDDKQRIIQGVKLSDGVSKLKLSGNQKNWVVTMHEGRNRQIRRTFEHCGYKVTKLHRTNFGQFSISDTEKGRYRLI